MADYLKSILDAFHDLLFVFTKDGIIKDYVAANREDELILPKEAFKEKNHREVLPAHISEKIDQAFHKLDQGQDKYIFDYNIELKGSTQWYNAVISKFEYGDNPKYLGVVRNITDRKNQELLVHSILDTSPGGIMVLRAVRSSEDTITDFKITHVNRSVEILTDTAVGKLVGRKLTTIIDESEKEKILNQFKTVAESGIPLEFQHQHRNKQNQVIWYHGKVVKYRDGVVSTFLDITQQKETEENLAAKNEELQKINRQKDKLFSVISHDLINTIAGAQGICDLIFEDHAELSKEEIIEYLKLLKKRTNNTHELLEDLLAWSKNQFQEITVNLEKIGLDDLTNSVLKNVRAKAEEKRISLHNQVSDNIYIHADINMVKAVLRNLINNGIKFSQPGGKVVVSARKTGDNIEISVIDKGVGIEKDAVEKVLSQKGNYTTPGTDGEIGSGLGLDLCTDFVEMHGGKIWVESEPDQGTVFTFTLPAY